ncbi:MAG: adenylate/guanylate cyclase domain-containing protein, partial [Desulfobacteraceae bacterium]|nr:adenylate/guanylate cyclase domain-containing protein [Desulfobacteraceae bacterium]
YSILMADDEVHTVKKLNEYRDSMSSIIQSNSGRVVDAVGDNLLAEFSSAVDAVQCSVEIQRDLKKKNKELTQDRRLEFRIGINIGDVIHEKDRIYGSGVNVAARIEGLAEPGGVCISQNAYDHLKNKLELGYEYFGEHAVKNIKDPVRVYKVLMDPADAGKVIDKTPKPLVKPWILPAIIVLAIVLTFIGYQLFQKNTPPEFEPASIENMAFPLPEKPSIAVLPFDNMSGDPKQDSLADGVTENIISGLALIPEMLVISRYSMLIYKSKHVKVQQVSEELGVRYVLEGSILMSKDRVRITAQLIDALTGYHIWTNHYDRNMKDLFDLLDEITKKITVELQVKLTHGDMARLWHKTDNFEAWGLAVKAWSTIEYFSRENVSVAQQLAQRAVKLDPEYGFAWSLLAYTHFHQALRGWTDSPEESYEKSVSLNLKALELDNTLWCATAMLGSINLYQGNFEKAIELGKKSIALGPNIALNYPVFAQTLLYAGRFEEAIAICNKGIRLHPYYPVWYLSFLGLSYRLTGRFDEAIKIFNMQLERAKQGETSPLDPHLNIADVLSELGEYQKA